MCGGLWSEWWVMLVCGGLWSEGLFRGLRGGYAGQGVGRGGGRREGVVAHTRGRRGEGGDFSHGCSSLLALSGPKERKRKRKKQVRDRTCQCIPQIPPHLRTEQNHLTQCALNILEHNRTIELNTCFELPKC